jgi:hypothetical protein
MKETKAFLIDNSDENFVSGEENFIKIRKLRRRMTRAKNKYGRTD